MDHPTQPAGGGGLRARRPLDGGWRLRLANPHPDAPASLIGASIPATVPGNVPLDLLAADVIPDPYLGANELALRWVGHCDWTYECSFDWAGMPSDRHDLVLEGLDTVASVWLDGRHLGDAASMHRSWRWEVTNVLTTRPAHPRGPIRSTGHSRRAAGVRAGRLSPRQCLPRTLQHAPHHGLQLRLGLGPAAAGCRLRPTPPSSPITRRPSTGWASSPGVWPSTSLHPSTSMTGLYLTQVNQARAITLGVEHLRSIRDVCSGTIVWQLNDCWPVISWSAIDGDGRRKPMWYALRRAYTDRLVTIQPAEFRLRTVLVNETNTTWLTEIHARRMRLDGALLAEWRTTARVAAPGMTTIDLPGSVGVPQHATE